MKNITSIFALVCVMFCAMFYVSVYPSSLFAKENVANTNSAKENLAKAKQPHRHEEAHVHGGATLNIAFDQLNGKIEFKAASMGVLGFEHEAKSENDKKTVTEVIAQFEKHMNTMVLFDSTLGCIFEAEKIENQKHGAHFDFIANFKVTCQKSILASKMTLDFSTFKKIKDIDVTVLADNLQKTAEVKTKPLVIDLL